MQNNLTSVSHWRAEITLLFVTFIWGISFVPIKNLVASQSPYWFNGVRFFIAAIVIYSIFFQTINHNLFIRYTQTEMKIKNPWWAGLWLGILLFIGYTTQTVGLIYTTVSKSGFITGMSVVMVPVFVIFIEKYIPRWPSLLGVFLAIMGLYLLTFPKGSKFNLGDFLTFICAIAFALQIVSVEILTKKHDFITLVFIQIVVCAVLSMPAGYLIDPAGKLDWNPSLIGIFFLTSVLATAFAFYAQFKFQKYTSATRTALIFATEPVFAALAGWFFLNETLGLLGAVGGGMIFGGIIISEIGK